MSTTYAEFIERKSQAGTGHGFVPAWLPDASLFPFQRSLTNWAIRQGRSAILADCGLGKSRMQLIWAENVIRHTNRPVLLLTPLAVAEQMCEEAEAVGVEAVRSLDGKFAPGAKVIVTNYERLHHFDPDSFDGVSLDESSILKSFSGKYRKEITRFMSKKPYRLFSTATPSPNDYTELGTTSEALGDLSYSDMLRRFFQQLDDKGQKRELRKQEEAEKMIASDPSYYKKLAFRVSQTIGQWRLRHHAVDHFWRWIASWARACRLPSDLGFSDDGYVLPPLIETDHIIDSEAPPDRLFTIPAIGMHEERQERKRTLKARCEKVAALVDHDGPAAIWCHTNEEGDYLARIIPNSAQVAGKTPDEKKVELYQAFAKGQLQRMIIKPKIGAWGLNWQHCAHVVEFPTHSWEQHKQLIARCQRFGQKSRVRVDVVATEGEVRVLQNLRAKGLRAEAMFAMVVSAMNEALRIERPNLYINPVECPPWL